MYDSKRVSTYIFPKSFANMTLRIQGCQCVASLITLTCNISEITYSEMYPSVEKNYEYPIPVFFN